MRLLEAVQIAGFLGMSQEEVLRHAAESSFPPPGIAETLDRLVDEGKRNEHASFATLVRAAGLDPARDFIGAYLADVDFRDEDLHGSISQAQI